LCDASGMPSTKPVAAFSYTDAELPALWRECLAVVSIKGQTYQLQGRTFTHFDLREIREMVQYLEERVDAASGIAVTNIRFRRAE
jgi:hypothetical protein